MLMSQARSPKHACKPHAGPGIGSARNNCHFALWAGNEADICSCQAGPFKYALTPYSAGCALPQCCEWLLHAKCSPCASTSCSNTLSCLILSH